MYTTLVTHTVHNTDPSETTRGHRQSPRGGDATVFGADVTVEFLRKNDLKVLWNIFVLYSCLTCIHASNHIDQRIFLLNLNSSHRTGISAISSGG